MIGQWSSWCGAVGIWMIEVSPQSFSWSNLPKGSFTWKQNSRYISWLFRWQRAIYRGAGRVAYPQRGVRVGEEDGRGRPWVWRGWERGRGQPSQRHRGHPQVYSQGIFRGSVSDPYTFDSIAEYLPIRIRIKSRFMVWWPKSEKIYSWIFFFKSKNYNLPIPRPP